jgi:hypothetical protein
MWKCSRNEISFAIVIAGIRGPPKAMPLARNNDLSMESHGDLEIKFACFTGE